MYNAATLKTELLGLVGWRQNEDSGGTQLQSMTTSVSGLWFNDAHPLLTIDSLLSVAPDYEKLHSGNQALINTSFTNWLQEKTEAGILFAINEWIQRKFAVKTAKNLLERKQLLDVSGHIQNTDTNKGKLVGFELVPKRSLGTTIKIEQIGLQLTDGQDVDVYLFHSESTAHKETTTITYAGSGGLVWKTVNWELSGTGTYYIVYQQNGMAGNSVNGVQDYSYHKGGATIYPAGKYFNINAFEITAAETSLWDISHVAYVHDTNFGLNLKMSVHCDYTTLITEQKDLFKTVIQKGVAMTLLREFAFNGNVRINRHESNASQTTVLYEIDGDSQGRPGGLKKEFVDAIEAITFDFEGIDRTCLPCRKRSVRYSSI